MSFNPEILRRRFGEIEQNLLLLEQAARLPLSAGIYDDELAKRLAAMSRFRNLLVHRYWGLDPATVHGFLPQSLADLRDDIAAVAHQAQE